MRFPRPARTGTVAPRPPRPAVRGAWLARIIGRSIAAYVELVARTCRFEGGVRADRSVVAVWHEANLTGLVVALARRRHLPHASFSTQGFRGVVITTLLEYFGIEVVPLPPEDDRAAARSLSLRLAGLAADGYAIGVTCDGPFGPARVAKPGALLIAREAGLPVDTLSPGARPAIRLPRWDRQIVPLPFARVWAEGGRRFDVAPRTSVTRALVSELGDELNRLAGRTEERMRGR